VTGQTVAILPLGNTGSLQRAFERLGWRVQTTLDPGVARAAARLVVPGVGRFGAYMTALREHGLDRAIGERIEAGAPTLCVCVGMQALGAGSAEDPDVPGLAVLPIRCERVSARRSTAFGWTPLAGSPDQDASAYFVHSYGFAAQGARVIPGRWLVASHIEGAPFGAAFERGRLLAAQFHPEKSGAFGQAFLRRWLAGESAISGDDAWTGAGPMTRRVIPCLDVSRGRLVKGTRFVDLVDHGDPAEAAARYEAQGADEIVVLDISATPDDGPTRLAMVREVADSLSIPLTVGGGVRTVADAAALFDAGADKVAVNSAAVRDPALITAIADRWGAQACVLAIDARLVDGRFVVCTHGGRTPTEREAVAWAREGEARGAGEILLTSMDRDGTNLGFDTPLLEAACAAVGLPVIASGGFGAPAHAPEAIAAGADAVLLAGALHRGETTISRIKRTLADAGEEVRACLSPA
jgi:imidazole glycerol phosphate synthase glutamine amidotransferase subunit